MDAEVERDWGAEEEGEHLKWSRKGHPKEYRTQGCTSDSQQTNKQFVLFIFKAKKKTGKRNKCLSQAKGEVLD